MGQITQFPGTIAARNALSDPKTSPEARTAAHEILLAASCRDGRVLAPEARRPALDLLEVARRAGHRSLTADEMAAIFPLVGRKANLFPPLAPPEDHRGPQMLVAMAGVMAAVAIAAAGIWAGAW